MLRRHLKKYLRNTPHKIKIFQTHKEFQAINYLQRNRNWSDGHLIIPTTWSINNWTIAETLKLIVEPGGAVAVAALLANKIKVKNKTVVVMLSGGNIDQDLFVKILNTNYE